jgi:outer membrane protein assembly factor BamB
VIALPQVAAARASVAKVASTGFGSAYCLARQPAAAGAQPDDAAQAQLYTYTSNYLFKTSASYNTPTWRNLGWGTIAQGLGLLFVADVQVGARKVTSAIAALDLQTGQERWRYDLSPNLRCTNPVFDPINQLVYYGTSDGRLVAVDARNGDNLWAYGTQGGAAIDAEPALQGSTLCFGDCSGAVYAFDTLAAARSAPGTTQTPRWRGVGPIGTAATRVGTPLIFDGAAFVVSSLYNDPSAPPTEFAVTRWDVVSGEQDPGFRVRFTLTTGVTASGFIPRPPVAGITTGLDGNDTPAIFVNAADRIVALYWTPFARVGWKEYQLEASPWATSDLTYDGGRLWFGSEGRLYALDGRTLKPTANTPAKMPFTWGVATTPVVYADSAGNSYVLFAAAISSEEHRLWIFDPSQPAGQANPASVDTGQTTIAQLSATVTNGVVYAAGSADWSPSQPAINPAAGQVFAINLDRATQALRDFIIESQLMQDFDDPPQPQTNADPPTFARYQTHLTVVDQHKAPRPFEAVKVWADQPTVICIDGGAPVTVGPGDDDFAVAQTGADGSVTITTGHVNNDGSDDTNLFATPLRAWAGFMDQYERVVIYPDREFHNRVATAQAVTDPTKPNYDNPDVVNLQTAQNYSGTALFTTDEQKQQQPQNIANAVQAMTEAVGVGGGGSSRSLAARTGRVAGQLGKYIAYDELSGCGYFATNVPAARTATVIQPVGLSYASNDDDSVPSSFTTLAHADATAAIDTLDGRDWTQSQLAAGPLLGGWWASFWHWLNGAAAKITHIIVSVGKEIYAGIRFIYNDVAYFFKHPLQALEDIVSAIGAFFQKLAKLIENVVEALSILFHFDEIVKTHTILRDELLKRINGDPANPAVYPGYVKLIKNSVIPNVDAFFNQGEDAIKTVLDNFKKQLDPGQKISTLHGAGSTPTTVFTVGPRGKSTPASSHSVHCTWAMHKMSNGLRHASADRVAASASGPTVPQALLDFFNTFADRIGGDGDLHATLQDAKTDITRLFSAKSLGEFVERGLSVLLGAVELLLEGVLSVANAFIDGLIGVFADLLTFLFDPNSGLLTRTINIPVLSWLYKKFFGEDLTILNLIMLVAAIPVTIVYRVLTGHYPSKDLQPPPGLLGEAINRPALRNTFGILGVVCTIVVAPLNAVVDFLVSEEGYDYADELEDITTATAICVALIAQGTTEPQAGTRDPGAMDWAIWGVGFAPIGLATLSYVFGAISPYKYETGEAIDKVASVVLSLSSIAIWTVATIATSNKKKPNTVDLLAYAAVLLATAPGIINPLKYIEIIGLVVPAMDEYFGWASAACVLAATELSWDEPVEVALTH